MAVKKYAKQEMPESFKVGSGKVGGKFQPLDAGEDIGVVVLSAIKGKDKKGRPDIRLKFGQIGAVGKTADVYVGFAFPKGFQQYIDYLFYAGVSAKAGLDPNGSVTPKKITDSLQKGAKALAGAKFNADINHVPEKYKGKWTDKADIVQVRKYVNPDGESESESDEDIEDDFDETEDEVAETKPKPKKEKKKVENVVEEDSFVDDDEIEGDDEDEVVEEKPEPKKKKKKKVEKVVEEVTDGDDDSEDDLDELDED